MLRTEENINTEKYYENIKIYGGMYFNSVGSQNFIRHVNTETASKVIIKQLNKQIRLLV